MNKDIATSSPKFRHDGNGVLVDAKNNRLKRVGKVWASLPRNAKVEPSNKLMPVLVESLPHLYLGD